MRLLTVMLLALVLAAPAAAATAPAFGVFSLSSGLATASQNEFGDVQVSASRARLARKVPAGTLALCAASCRLGQGWLAFTKPSPLSPRDVLAARAAAGRRGWTVSVTLSRAGQARWQAFSAAATARAKKTGLPDALVVVVAGRILAQPLASELPRKGATLLLTGFFRADAVRVARAFG